ncbi:Alpha/Beta hydrolase protein [Coniochaeta sp. 2T2.1]|nr:Alpha/Beta hydrolase protein [Coniochaeta sp. 2T2.1]
MDEPLYLPTAPPLDPAWLAYEASSGIARPKPALPPLERQPLYAEECRRLTASMVAPGARDEHLAKVIKVTPFTVKSELDGFAIPVVRHARDSASASTAATSDEGQAEGGEGETETTTTTIVIYIHGGGLMVGEADSEELSCRRIVADSDLPDVRVYSIGYRLMPLHPASTCLHDCVDAFNGILARESQENEARGTGTNKVLVLGSSSGGELAALLAGKVGKSQIKGLALRCPVTSDAWTDFERYVPERFRELHTSTRHESFANCLLGKMVRSVPRDGLEYMPLEAGEEELRGMPTRAWVQVCSNDGLYSDGVCYARALEEVGVEVKVDVVRGWPHTFWLKAPGLERALEAEREMLRGLRWLAE